MQSNDSDIWTKDSDFSNIMCSYGEQTHTHTHTHICRHILGYETQRRQRRTDSDRATEHEETDYSKYQPPPLQAILEDNNVAASQRHTHTHTHRVQQKGGTRPPPASPPGPAFPFGPPYEGKAGWACLAPQTPTILKLLHPSSLVSLTN